MKIHGLIVTDCEGKLVTGPYGDVLLFKSREDAAPHLILGGSKAHRVVTAKVRRNPRPQTKEGKS